MKTQKRIVNVILIFLLTILIVGLVSVKIIQTELGFKSNKPPFLIEEVSAKEVNVNKIKNISTITPELIHKYADDELEKRGIPKEALDYILKEEDYNQIFQDYKQEAIGYLSEKTEAPKLPMDKIHGMIDRGVKKYNEATNSELKVDDLKEEMNKVANKIDQSVKKIAQNKTVISAFKILSNPNLTIYIGVAIFVIVILLIILNNLKNTVLYIGISSIIAAILSFILSFAFNLESLKGIKTLLGIQATSSYLTYGFIILTLGIIMIAIHIATKIVEKKTNYDQSNTI